MAIITQTLLRNKAVYNDHNFSDPYFHGWLNILNLHSVKQSFWVIAGGRLTAGYTWLSGRILTFASNEFFLYGNNIIYNMQTERTDVDWYKWNIINLSNMRWKNSGKATKVNIPIDAIMKQNMPHTTI